jgi:cysteine synthase A
MNIEDLIGNTPLVELKHNIYAKLETFNLSGSIKDRIILYILIDAEGKGKINEKTTLVEATSGNTGIALSMLGAIKNYKVKIIMPSNMSAERKQLMLAFGAEIVEVAPNDFPSAIALRDKFVQENENFWSPNQFSNPLNVKCHEETTGREITRQLYIERFKDIDVLVSGAGTGGTIMGVGKALRKINPNLRIVQVKPAEPPLDHGIQGIGDGGDYLVDPAFIDEVIYVNTEDAIQKSRDLASEGLLVGVSSGANIWAAEKYIEDNSFDGNIITFLPDRGERYLSLF